MSPRLRPRCGAGGYRCAVRSIRRKSRRSPPVPDWREHVPADSCRNRARPNEAPSRGRSADGSRHVGFSGVPPDGRTDFAEQLVTYHFVSHLDRRGEAFRIGAAMALDYDTIEPKENPAVRFSWIHLVTQHAERRPRQQIAEFRPDRL